MCINKLYKIYFTIDIHHDIVIPTKYMLEPVSRERETYYFI